MFKWKVAAVAGLALMFTVGSTALICTAAQEKGESRTKSSTAHARWTESLQEAIAASETTGRPVMANFTGSDWCPPCMAQEREVFATPEFAEWAQENVILLLLDFPNDKAQHADTVKQNAALAEEFQVNGYPTLVFFSHKGQEYGRWSGYGSGMGFENWVKRAQPLVDKAAAAKAETSESEKT